MKDFQTIEKIRKILAQNGRRDLADLLKECWGYISDTGRFGNYWSSTISSYHISASFEHFLKLQKLDELTKSEILKAILMLYPHKENSPEIRDIEFVVDDEIEIDNSIFVSTEKGTKEKQTKITFTPSIFNIPNELLKENLVSVMMPFNGFDEVYDAIKSACQNSGFEYKRADDIWTNSTFIQDIFELIYLSNIVIVDFTGKNPNVMYETGIAHTLGKIVIPISQSLNDVPSDLRHHRVLIYLPNSEGLKKLCTDLSVKLNTYKSEESYLSF